MNIIFEAYDFEVSKDSIYSLLLGNSMSANKVSAVDIDGVTLYILCSEL